MKFLARSSFMFLVFAIAIIPAWAHAQPKNTGEVIRVVENLLRDISTLFWIAAVGFILYAGFLFFTGADNPERVKKARGQLLYTVLAIVIALLATAIPALIESILSRTS